MGAENGRFVALRGDTAQVSECLDKLRRLLGSAEICRWARVGGRLALA
jgi:hypothetical protein